MKKLTASAGGYLAALGMAASLGVAAPSFADTPPDFSVTFPAGLTCPFELQVDGWSANGTANRVDLTFKEDKNGFIRSISAGVGYTLHYTNTSNAKTMSTKANGAVSHSVTYTADGSQTVSATGHNVLFLFPTDVPPGPAAILYVGRVVYTVAPVAMGGYFTVRSFSGRTVDICAALT